MKWFHASIIIGPIIGIFGFTLLFITLHSIFSSWRLKKYGKKVTATIISKGSKVANAKTQKGQTCTLNCRFMVDNVEYINNYHIAPKIYIKVHVGHHILVFYDPINPKNTELNYNMSDDDCMYMAISMIFGIGISTAIFIVLPFVIWNLAETNGSGAVLLAYGIALCVAIPICSLRCYKGGYCC